MRFDPPSLRLPTAFLMVAWAAYCVQVYAAAPVFDDIEAQLESDPGAVVEQLMQLDTDSHGASEQVARARYLCEGLSNLGKFSDALAVDIRQAAQDQAPTEALRWKLCQARAAGFLGRSTEALASLDQAIAQAVVTNSPGLEIEGLLLRGDLYIQANQHELAMRSLTRAYEVANTIDDEGLRFDALNALAMEYYNSGQLESARRFFLELVELAEARGDASAMAIAQLNRGHVYGSEQDFANAEASFLQALAHSREANDVSGEAFALKALGVSAHAQQKNEEAEQKLKQAGALFIELGDERQVAAVFRNLGDIALDAENYADAIVYYQQAQPFLQRYMFHKPLLRTYRGLSKAYAATGDFERAYLTQRAYVLLLREDLESQNLEVTQRMQVQFETQRFSDENTRLEIENEAQQRELSLRQQRSQLQYLALVLVLVVAFLSMVLWQRSRRHAMHMQELATTDVLTQMLNRRAIYDIGEREWQRSVRFERPLTVLIFDIDHFKSINDSLGHAVGDEALKAVSAAGKSAIRQTDAIGRIGGEEFLVVCSETDVSQAMHLAERIRTTIESTRHAAMPDRTVTVSIGVAQRCGDESLGELVSRADKALYQAKESGRNRVNIAPADM